MTFDATKPVFGVSDKARLKSVSSATETSKKNQISPVASIDKILSKKGITMAMTSLRRCEGWSTPLLFAHPEDRFSRVEGHIIIMVLFILTQVTLYTLKSSDVAWLKF